MEVLSFDPLDQENARGIQIPAVHPAGSQKTPNPERLA